MRMHLFLFCLPPGRTCLLSCVLGGATVALVLRAGSVEEEGSSSDSLKAAVKAGEGSSATKNNGYVGRY